jgi:cobalt-zinc-cadmium efflux system protein
MQMESPVSEQIRKVSGMLQVLSHGKKIGYHANMHAHNVRGESRKLFIALALILGFAAIEAFFAYRFGSVALFGDAGHMLSDSFALAIAASAAILAARPPSSRHSYGLVRIEVIAAFINGMVMLLVIIAITYTAVKRFAEPLAVNGLGVMVVASIGLITNLVVYKILHGEHASLNTRAARLHVLGDILGSVAALAAGVIIYFTAWYPIDPILSIFICLIILAGTFKLLKLALTVLLEGVPIHLDLEEIGYSMAAVESVESVHDLHIWSLSSGQIILTAHIVMKQFDHWSKIYAAISEKLLREFNIDHVTLQPELSQDGLHKIVMPK